MKTVLFSIGLVWASAAGFTAPLTSGRSACAVRTKSSEVAESPQVPTALFYRELDQDDDAIAMQKLQMRTPPNFDLKQALRQKPPKSAINTPLIQALLVNQGLILGFASLLTIIMLIAMHGLGFDLNEVLRWTGQGPSILDFSLTVDRVLWGIGGALPLLALSAFIEQSDNRLFSNINFATIVMALTLFGRRQQPPPEFLPAEIRGLPLPISHWREVALWSALLSTITGVCEETVFRCFVPAVLMSVSGNNWLLTLLGQSVLFGLGHTQPKVGLAENSVVAGLQAMNGLGFGLIYLLSGGDLVPAIIAHALFDFVGFFKTWLDANEQLEYAESMVYEPLPHEMEVEVRRILHKTQSVKIDLRFLNSLKRLFYTFDFDKNRSLSLSEVRKGISYLALELHGRPPLESEVDQLFRATLQLREHRGGSDRLSFADFVRLYSMMMSKKQEKD